MTTAAKPGAPRPALEADEEEAPRTAPRRRRRRARPAPAPKPPRGGGEKRRGRLTVVTALSADEVRERSVASFRRRVQRMTGHRDRAEGKDRPRSDDPGDDHDPGTGQPHGRTRAST